MKAAVLSVPAENVESMVVRGEGWCPLVLGECVQGRLEDGLHFLITAPIPVFVRGEFHCDPSISDLTIEPAACVKTLKAVVAYMRDEGLPERGRLRVHDTTRPGLGFGTSTGDITACLRAVASAWGRQIPPETISRLAVAIEPTDGSMYEGSVAYAHREGRLLERLGELPAFRAVGVIAGEGFDTVGFDEVRKDFRYPSHEVERLRSAWRLVREANRTGNVRLLAEASTASAEINQQLLPNPLFGELNQPARQLGAEGCFVAHSGTLASLIFDPARPDSERCVERAKRHLESLEPLGMFDLANREPGSEVGWW